MKMLRTILFGSAIVGLIGCNQTPNQGGSAAGLDQASSFLSSYPSNSANLRMSLTDAPSRELDKVFVNINHAELFVKKGSQEGRIIVAQGLGLVDLMTLRNGVLLPMQDLNLATGVQITSIRLVLNGDNNHAIKKDGSRCEMKTPSAQQSGIKIKLASPFTLENNYVYSMVLDFDAEKSVVVRGNGGCLLKPVLKLLQVTRKINEPAPVADNDSTDEDDNDDGSTAPIEEPVTDGNDINLDPVPVTDTTPAPSPVPTPDSSTNDGSGFEPAPSPVAPSEPPVISIEDSFNLG